MASQKIAGSILVISPWHIDEQVRTCKLLGFWYTSAGSIKGETRQDKTQQEQNRTGQDGTR